MKRFLSLQIAIMLWSWTGFSQESFPKWIAFEGNQVYAFTLPQLRDVHKVYLERDCYIEQVDTLMQILSEYDTIINIQKRIIASLDKEMESWQQLMPLYQEKNASLQLENNEIKRKLKSHKITSIIIQGGLSVVIALLML